MKFEESIAAGLRSQRAKAHISQSEVADSLGFFTSTLSSWENNGGLKIKDAWKLADFYNVSLDELVGRDRDGK